MKSKFDRFLDRGIYFLSIFAVTIYIILLVRNKSFQVIFNYMQIGIVVIAIIGFFSVLYLQINLRKVQEGKQNHLERIENYIQKQHFTTLDRLLDSATGSDSYLKIFKKLLIKVMKKEPKLQSENEIFKLIEREKGKLSDKKFSVLMFVNISPILFILFCVAYFRVKLYQPGYFPPETFLHISLIIIFLFLVSYISLFFYNRLQSKFESILSDTSEAILKYIKEKGQL